MNYEVKKIVRRSQNKIILAILLFIVLFSSIMPIKTYTTTTNNDSSNLLKGREAIKLDKERYKDSKGELTLETIKEFIDKVSRYPSNEAAYLDLSVKDPALLKILSYAYSTDEGSYLTNAKKSKGADFYEKNQDQIEELFLMNEENYKSDEKQEIFERAKELDKPYNMAYSKQWNLLYKSFGVLYIATAIGIIVQVSSVFSYEKEKAMDKVLNSSANSIKEIINNKISAVISIISVEWIILSVLLIIIFGINFGFSGFSSQIQIEYFTSIYNLTFGKALIIEVILGLFTLISIGVTTIMINMLNESTLKTLIISISITFIPVLLLRFPGLNYSLFRLIETLPIFGGNINGNLLTLNIYRIFNITVLRTTKILFNTTIITTVAFLIIQIKTKTIGRKL